MNRIDQIYVFLEANNLSNLTVNLIAGDASFRKYYRTEHEGENYIIMDAPTEHEEITPFINIAKFLIDNDFSAPDIIAYDEENGFILLEDLGEGRFTQILNNEIILANPVSEKQLYESAIDALLELYDTEISIDLPQYDSQLLMREVNLLIEWFFPLANIELTQEMRTEYEAIWSELIIDCNLGRNIVVLRDYHADNLMWLADRSGVKKVGLLDFQDAVIGSPAYDLASLLEDARRDVAPDFADEMLQYYLANNGDVDKEEFLLSYAILAAQRNCKIVGIFARLAVRDGKVDYLSFLPRVWNYLEQDLKHPYLKHLNKFLEKHVRYKNRREIIEPKNTSAK